MTKATSARRGDLFDPRCPARQLLDRIGTKWTSMAVKVLAEADPGEVRFAELRRRMPGISQKMLSVTLQSLVRDGLVARRVEPTVPPGVHYRLTDLGLSLEGPLSALRTWAEAHMPDIERNNRLADADDAHRRAEKTPLSGPGTPAPAGHNVEASHHTRGDAG